MKAAGNGLIMLIIVMLLVGVSVTASGTKVRPCYMILVKLHSLDVLLRGKNAGKIGVLYYKAPLNTLY